MLLISILQRLRYTLLGSSTAAMEDNTTKFRHHLGHILLSKSARGVALLLFIILLLTLSAAGLPHNIRSKSFRLSVLPSAARNDTNGTNDHVDAKVDWSRFAYVQYATNDAYLCNSVVLFESLHRLETKADRLLMYPSDFQLDDDPNTDSFNGRLLKRARDKYNVKLKPIQVQSKSGGDGKFGTVTTTTMWTEN